MKMRRLHAILVTLLCVQVQVAVSRKIFIANGEGNDKQSCGTPTSPCESIKFAIETISTSSEDMVILDGGTVNPSVYDVGESIVLERDLNLWKCKDSLLNPIISYSGTSTIMIHAFVVPRNKALSVIIHSVDFSNVGTVFCNASKECNITMYNSSSKVNNQNLTTRSQIALHDFLFSHLSIKNCSFEHTGFAMYAESERTISLHMSIVKVQLTNSKVENRLNAANGKVYGEIHRLTATYSSSVFITASNLHLNLSNSLFSSNKCDRGSLQQYHGVLVKLISSERSNESFVRISNVQFYNNTQYNVLIEVAGEKLKKNSILESVIENIHVDSNELYGNKFVVVKTSTTSLRLRNLTIITVVGSIIDYYGVKSTSIFSIKTRRFDVRNIQLSAINVETLVSLLEGEGEISDLSCTSSNLALGFTAKSLTNVRIVGVTFVDIAWKWPSKLFLIKKMKDVTIKNISISHNINTERVFAFWFGRNISIENISFKNSSCTDTLFYVRFSSYMQFQNINVKDSGIGWLFQMDMSNNLMIRNLYIVKNTIQNNFIRLFHLQSSAVTEVVLENNTINTNLLELSKTKNMLIQNWTISGNNISSQVIELTCIADKCVDFMNLNIYQNMVLMSAIIVNRGNMYSKSTFRDLYLRGNHIKKYVFEIDSCNDFILTSTQIENNSYETCIYARNSLISMRDVSIKGNQASGFVKETHLVNSHDMPAGAGVILSNVSIITSKVSSMDSSNDANFWELFKQISVVMENVTINILPFQTIALRMKLSALNETAIASDYEIQCPKGSFTSHETNRTGNSFQIISMCTVCEKGTYNLYGASFRVKESKLLRTVNRHSTAESACTKCPYGGVCDNGNSISRGNFFGFESKRSKLTYIPCPQSYCCSDDNVKCTDRNTCSSYRRSTLCGDCITGYHENVFGTLCSKISDCISQIGFWAFHSLAAALLLSLHCYIDCVGIAFSAIAIFLHKCFRQCKKGKKEDGTKNAVTKLEEQHSATNDGYKNNDQCMKQTSATNSSDKTSSIQINEYLALNNRAGIERCLQLNVSVHISDDETTVVTENYAIKKQPDEIEIADTHTTKTISTEPSSYTISGVIQVLISFYQIRSLIRIELNQENNFVVPNILDDIINAKMFLDIGDSFCPYLGVDAVGKAFISNVMLGINMMFLLSLSYLFTFIYRSIFAKRKPTQCSRMPFYCRLEVCYLRVLLFSYKNVATFCFLALNCVSMGDKYILYIEGTTTCLQRWQYLVIGFGVCWVLPFPFVMSHTYQMYRQKFITFHMLMLCVTVPPFAMFLVARNFCKPFRSFCQSNGYQLNVLKQIFEEPYRLRNGETDSYIFWEHFRMIQSLLISAVVTFVTDALWRNMILMPLILCFFLVYIKVRPLKKNLVVLYWMEITSLLALCYHVFLNLFKAFLYVLSIPAEGSVQSIKSFVVYSEFVVSPAIVLVVYVLFIPVYKGIVNAVRREKVE